MISQNECVLHIFTPMFLHSLVSLKLYELGTDCWVIDFSRFPPLLFKYSQSGTFQDVTTKWVPKRDFWVEIHDWLASFTIKSGLQDVLSIDGYGFWWTLNAQKFVPGLTELGNAFIWINLLKAIRDQLQPDFIYVYGNHAWINHLLKQTFPDVKIKIIEGNSSTKIFKNSSPRHLGLLITRVLLGVTYLLYSCLRPPDICFLTSTNLLRKVSRRFSLRDIYLQNIADALRNRGWRIAMVEKYGRLASWSRLISRKIFFPSDIFYLFSHPIMTKIGFYRGIFQGWQQKWRGAKAEIEKNSSYQGYDISPLILPLIADEFLRRAPTTEILVNIWKRLFSFWKPKLTFVNDSYGPGALPIIIASKTAGITSVEMQHGLIGKNHFAYLIPVSDKFRTKFPLCDYIAVWGEYTKRFLSNASIYDTSQIWVSGNPRIDALLEELPSREPLLSHLGIPLDKKVALYTDNGFAWDWMTDILDGIRNVPLSSEIYWLIKLHPQHKIKKIWMREIERRQIKNISVLEGDHDFYALLNACDVHISFTSTTLIEAAILGKPNIGIDVPNVIDPGGYKDAKAFYPSSPKDLGKTVNHVLKNHDFKQTIIAEQKAFAEDWCLHDGNATSRLVDLVESLIHDS